MYPDCPTITRTIDVGGLTQAELINALQREAISINEAGIRLLASAHFSTSAERLSVLTVELTVADLGFPQGATIAQLYNKADALGLGLCPLELGPHMRLQYADQPEGCRGKPLRRHQAPFGSITIASERIVDEVDFPEGFYLRRIQDVMWLRGYLCGPEHLWSPDDHFVFCR